MVVMSNIHYVNTKSYFKPENKTDYSDFTIYVMIISPVPDLQELAWRWLSIRMRPWPRSFVIKRLNIVFVIRFIQL